MNRHIKEIESLKIEAERFAVNDRVDNKDDFLSITKDCDTILTNLSNYEEWTLEGACRQLNTKLTESLHKIPEINVFIHEIEELNEGMVKTKSENKKAKLKQKIDEVNRQMDQMIEGMKENGKQMSEGEQTFPRSVITDIENIIPNPYQPRKTFDKEKIQSLADSIKESGLLQPPVVLLLADGTYQLVAGERRLRACKLLSWTEISVTVQDLSEEQAAAAALIENIDREDVNVLEQAEGIKRMIESHNLSQSDVAKRLGKTQAKISQWLSLLDLSPLLQGVLLEGKLNQSIGRIISSLPEEEQESLANHSQFDSLTAKNAQSLVNIYKAIVNMKEIEPESNNINFKCFQALLHADCIDILMTTFLAVFHSDRVNLKLDPPPEFIFKSDMFHREVKGENIENMIYQYFSHSRTPRALNFQIHNDMKTRDQASEILLDILSNHPGQEDQTSFHSIEVTEIIRRMKEETIRDLDQEQVDTVERVYQELMKFKDANEYPTTIDIGDLPLNKQELHRLILATLVQNDYLTDLHETMEDSIFNPTLLHSLTSPFICIADMELQGLTESKYPSLWELWHSYELDLLEPDHIHLYIDEAKSEEASHKLYELLRIQYENLQADEGVEYESTVETDDITGDEYDQITIPEEKQKTKTDAELYKKQQKEFECYCGRILKKDKAVKIEDHLLCNTCADHYYCKKCNKTIFNDPFIKVINNKSYCEYCAMDMEEDKSTKVPVLNPKPEKTKTGRILQILQEDRKETHPISDKCYNCRHFNENGNTYQDRCQGEYISFHSFKRYEINGQEFFTCDGFSPKEEYIESRKSKNNMDMKAVMFETLLYSESMYNHSEPDLVWMKKYYKPFRNVSPLYPSVVLQHFKEADEETQAYLVEVVSKRYQLTKAKSSGQAPLHTTDDVYKVSHKGLENAEDI
jgi:ParB/RepB/Spo0J family partition protein